MGVIFLQLSNFALKIKKQIEEDRLAQRTMKMSENEIKEHIKELKKEIFSDRLGTIS
jgi:ribosomal protein L29